MLNLISTLRKTAAITALILFGVSGAAADTDNLATDVTYTWSAELVAFDEATRMATLRHSLVGHPPQDLTGFSNGDRIILTWSGVHSAGLIRSIAPGEMARGHLAMPVEFAGFDGRYVTFRLPIPADYVNQVLALEPGEWVTATSPHAAPDHNAVVMDIRGFITSRDRSSDRVSLDVTLPETYTWSAALVAFDEAGAVATVRARLVEENRDDLSGLGGGDPIVLTWSGAYSAASGILAVEPGETAEGRFEMPVEFVSLEGRYVTFRTPVQADFVHRIKALEPGEWVTATSPHAAWDRNAVVMDIRGYTESHGRSTDNTGVDAARPRKLIQSTQFIDIDASAGTVPR